jgi:ubiquinone/menaquinone biosynthesis C-methylase UbiE
LSHESRDARTGQGGSPGRSAAPERGPDAAAAIEKYRLRAPGYDRRMRVTRAWRRAAVDRLLLREGDTVLDVACGTGINFSMLEERTGPGGRIIGIDVSPEMLNEARERTTAHGWANVSLIESPVEDARIEAEADGALFSFTHDVLQSERALANVAAHLRPGARVAAVGAKWGGRWNLPVNAVVAAIARRYVTTFENLDRPWQKLGSRVDLTVESVALGGVYLASGTVMGEA